MNLVKVGQVRVDEPILIKSLNVLYLRREADTILEIRGSGFNFESLTIKYELHDLSNHVLQADLLIPIEYKESNKVLVKVPASVST